MPLQCEFFALEGLSQLLATVDQVRAALNPALTIHGIVLTMFDSRNSLAAQVVADVRGFMGDKVYETVIPRNVRVSEAPSHGKPVLLYDLKCSGSQAYLKLASEVIQRERALRAGRDSLPESETMHERTENRAKTARPRLGRGLAALIGDSEDAGAATPREARQKKVPIEFLRPNPRNPRKTFRRDRTRGAGRLDQGEGHSAAHPGAPRARARRRL